MWYLLILVVVVCAFIFIDRPIILLKFEQGRITKSKGPIPKGFLTDCQDIGKKMPFDGVVKVYKNRFSTKLVFSKGIPSKVKQRIRNVFPHQAKLTGGKRA
uniref:DUF3634 family protein n=1 Tax=Thaumasiovibrio occultus TaxID=1891184 RepID=UPI000B3536C1|nr:DUF3634 family protein [Thaumasiovibrio occultus]